MKTNRLSRTALASWAAVATFAKDLDVGIIVEVVHGSFRRISLHFTHVDMRVALGALRTNAPARTFRACDSLGVEVQS